MNSGDLIVSESVTWHSVFRCFELLTLKNMAKSTKTKSARKPASARTTAKRKSPSKTNQKAKESIKQKNVDGSMLGEYFLHALKDIYWAENALLKALPKMSKEATSPDLKKAFNDHLEQTKDQIKRLERVFEKLGEQPKGKKCDAMAGLIEESESIIKETKDDTSTRDAALIIAAQKVEHYEIASYGGLIQLAKTMDRNDIGNILGPTLEEEKNADALLTKVAEQGGINAVASLEEAEDKPSLKDNIINMFSKK
jgi:ferritin-like metal-binding protein YciE